MNTKKAALTVLSITLKIVILAIVVMAVYRLGGAAYHYGHSVFMEEAVDPKPGRTAEVTIESGFSLKDTAKELQDEGLVEDWKLFCIQVKVSKYAKTMKSGTYTLSTAMKPREIMAVMSGEEVDFWEEES